MDYLEYINTVKKKINVLKEEDHLADWILSLARQVSKDKRGEFLDGLDYVQEDADKTIQDFHDFIQKIEDGKWYIQFENKNKSVQNNHYIYDDIFNIGKQLDKYYSIAEICTYEGKPEIAEVILQSMNQLRIKTVDKDVNRSYSYIRLSVYDLYIHGQLSVPYKDFCILTLYVTYLVSPEESRAERIVDVIRNNHYNNTLLVNLFEKLHITSEEKNAFLDKMINYFRKLHLYWTDVLLHYVLILRYGTDGLLIGAMEVIADYPGIVNQEMQDLLGKCQYNRIIALGKAYLERIPIGDEARNNYLHMMVEASYYLSDEAEERKSLEESFIERYSVSSAFALLTRFHVPEKEVQTILMNAKKYKENAINRDEMPLDWNVDNCVYLLSGNIEPALEELTHSKFNYDKYLLFILLILRIFDENNNTPVLYKMLDYMDFLFKNYNFYNISQCIHNWKEFYPLSDLEQIYLFDELLPYADKVARKILNAKKSNQYNKAALMLVAIAETGIRLGRFNEVMDFLDIYLNDYAKLIAFQKEIKQLGY